MKVIKLIRRKLTTKTKYTLVDDADYDWLSKFTWYENYKSKASYAVTSVGGKLIPMHQMLMPNPPTGLTPDHKDRDGLNNQRENLRWATDSQQNINRRTYANNTSGYRGVSFDKKRKLWQAYIREDGVMKGLGRFRTRDMAARAFNEAAKRLYGEFAVLNEIPAIN